MRKLCSQRVERQRHNDWHQWSETKRLRRRRQVINHPSLFCDPSSTSRCSCHRATSIWGQFWCHSCSRCWISCAVSESSSLLEICESAFSIQTTSSSFKISQTPTVSQQISQTVFDGGRFSRKRCSCSVVNNTGRDDDVTLASSLFWSEDDVVNFVEENLCDSRYSSIL